MFGQRSLQHPCVVADCPIAAIRHVPTMICSWENEVRLGWKSASIEYLKNIHYNMIRKRSFHRCRGIHIKIIISYYKFYRAAFETSSKQHPNVGPKNLSGLDSSPAQPLWRFSGLLMVSYLGRADGPWLRGGSPFCYSTYTTHTPKLTKYNPLILNPASPQNKHL
jgi:hypothetical protein